MKMRAKVIQSISDAVVNLRRQVVDLLLFFFSSSRLVKKDCQVFVQDSNITLFRVSDTRSPVSPNNTMPGGGEHLIEVLFDGLCDMFLSCVQSTGLNRSIQSSPLHMNRHVSCLYFEVFRVNGILIDDRVGCY